MTESDREFDVLVWGATGFTGQLVVEYLCRQYPPSGDLKWAVAGRNEEKLKSTIARIAGDKAAEIPVVIADSGDAQSIAAMVQRTRVVCTTVGPYARYGTPLVEACVAHGTHCCDLTGEVQWMRKTIDQFQTAAEESGAKIVHTCGFDSIPSDMGVWFMQEEMQRQHGVYANRVKFRVGKTRGGASGGTVESMFNMMEEAKEDPSLRELLADPYALNPLNMPRGMDEPDALGAVYDPDLRQWTAPFVMAAINTRVVRRSNALLGYRYGKDFRYDETMLMGDGPGGYMRATAVAGGSLMVMMAAAFSPTRGVLRRLAPSPGEGPDRDTIENGFFEIDLYACHPDDRKKNLRGRVTGDQDPGYGATSKMLAESAVCLARDDLEVGGGVWTPATAMGDKLFSRLTENAGMTFSIL